MLRRTKNDVPVRTQDAREMDIVVIVYNIIGKTKNCQGVSFQLMQRERMTGLLKTS